MTESAIKALIGAKLATTSNLEYPELQLLKELLRRWGLRDDYPERDVKEFVARIYDLLERIYTKRTIDQQDTFRAGYAAKIKYVPLSLGEVLKELMK